MRNHEAGRRPKNNYRAAVEMESRRVSVIWKSALVGLAAGAVAVLYRLALTEAETASFGVYAFVGRHPVWLFALFPALGLLGYGVGVLTKHNRAIGGSGIPQVKGAILGYAESHWVKTLLAKFLGGALAILAGLSLGREGPSIQLGASVAQGLGDRISDTRAERKILIASGAGAGLAAAFNAPLAGMMFVIEEIFKYISPVLLLSAMVSCILADSVARLAFGGAPVFSFPIQSGLPMDKYWMAIALGIVLGGAGALYNRFLLAAQKFYKKLFRDNLPLRVMFPFLLAGVLGLVFPAALGGGHAALEHMTLSAGLTFLLLLLAIKFAFSMLSFGSGAPGGIFFPLLIMGGVIGAVFGNIAVKQMGWDAGLFNNLIILGMAGYFAAIVRAPLTGAVLLLEMTGSFANLLPLTLVAVIASATADLLKTAPVYDALLENQLNEQGYARDPDDGGRITVETIVHHGAPAAGKRVRELSLPNNCLLIAIRREGKDIIPRGDTMVRANDYLIFLLSRHEEAPLREALGALTSAG